MAQTFMLKDKDDLRRLMLAGNYDPAMNRETITLSIMTGSKGPTASVWSQDYLLGDTKFLETEKIDPDATGTNVFDVDSPPTLYPETLYWLVISTTASGVRILDLDDRRTGDMNPSGSEFLYQLLQWNEQPTSDLWLQLNPCKFPSGGVILF